MHQNNQTENLETNQNPKKRKRIITKKTNDQIIPNNSLNFDLPNNEIEKNKDELKENSTNNFDYTNTNISAEKK